MEHLPQDIATQTIEDQGLAMPEMDLVETTGAPTTPEADDYAPTDVVVAAGSTAVLGWGGANTDHLIGKYHHA